MQFYPEEKHYLRFGLKTSWMAGGLPGSATSRLCCLNLWLSNVKNSYLVLVAFMLPKSFPLVIAGAVRLL